MTLTNTLKKIVPLPMRSQIKQFGYTVQDGLDIFKGPRPPRVPARRHTFIGGGDFIKVGEAFLVTLKADGLSPDEQILEIGCGQGRMARPLVEFLSDKGHYTGLDIVKSGIAWCQAQYQDVPNFTFQHANIYNQRYNPEGTIAPHDYKLPFEDNQFDRVFLTSVFTHMHTRDVTAYMAEIARVLKPGGRCVMSWFAICEAAKDAVANKTAKLDFHHPLDEVSFTTVAREPEAAIAFDMDFIEKTYAQSGLEMTKKERGDWAKIGNPGQLQDYIFARKPD